MRRLAALANGPHHERLTAPHIAGSEYFRIGALVGQSIGFDVAALVELELELFDHAFVHGMHEAHGEQHEISGDFELSACDRLDLLVNAHAMQLLHCAALAGKFGAQHGKIALGPFFVTR